MAVVRKNESNSSALPVEPDATRAAARTLTSSRVPSHLLIVIFLVLSCVATGIHYVVTKKRNPCLRLEGPIPRPGTPRQVLSDGDLRWLEYPLDSPWCSVKGENVTYTLTSEQCDEYVKKRCISIVVLDWCSNEEATTSRSGRLCSPDQYDDICALGDTEKSFIEEDVNGILDCETDPPTMTIDERVADESAPWTEEHTSSVLVMFVDGSVVMFPSDVWTSGEMERVGVFWMWEIIRIFISTTER